MPQAAWSNGAANAASNAASSAASNVARNTRQRQFKSVKAGGARTYAQLYAEASFRNIRGRSGMNKAALEKALSR